MSTTSELETLIDNALADFCKDHAETGIAKAAQTAEGFEDVALRVKQVLIKEFRNQKVALSEVIWWINSNEYDVE